MPRSSAQRPIASTSSGGYTAPVGLLGDTNSNAFVRGVHRGFELLDRDAEARRLPSWAARPGTPPPSAMHLGIRRPVRRGQQHLVARVAEHLERVVDRVLAAVGDDAPARPRSRRRSRAWSCARSPRAARAGPASASSGGSGGRGTRPIAASTMCVGRREVGLAGAEADDVLARRLQRLGLGVDRERRRFLDGGDACARCVPRAHAGTSGHAPWWHARPDVRPVSAPTADWAAPPSLVAHAPPPTARRARRRAAAARASAAPGRLAARRRRPARQQAPHAEGRHRRRRRDRARADRRQHPRGDAPREHRQDHDRARRRSSGSRRTRIVTVDARRRRGRGEQDRHAGRHTRGRSTRCWPR